MDKSSSAVCHAFLQTIAPKERQALLTHLPEMEAEALAAPCDFQGDPTLGVAPLEEELTRMHSSWLAPFLRSLSEGDIKIFLGCLTEKQQNGLKSSLLFSNHIPTISDLGKRFLRRQFFSTLAGQEDLLPISCLPRAPINDLLAMSYEELLSLIDLLSMHDLSVEIRHIIDTAKLKRIYALLTQPQTNFLKTLLYRKEPVVFKKMELTKWDGRTEELASTLEQRGINRLAKALYNEEPSLVWYIAHRLDADRGALLQKLSTPLDHPRAASLLSEQVTDLIQSLKNPQD
jgi:hypothetical protein